MIWALTNVSNKTRYELAVDMEDWSDNRRFARYRSFRLGSERDAFRLYHQNLYYGNAGDSLYSHNGMPFSTFDVDNDNRDGDFAESSCARLYKGGWWYGNCKFNFISHFWSNFGPFLVRFGPFLVHFFPSLVHFWSTLGPFLVFFGSPFWFFFRAHQLIAAPYQIRHKIFAN